MSGELKSRGKEVSKSAGKGSKAVDKARTASQKHIEKLGQHTAAFDSSSGKVSANDDPYVLNRGIFYRLKQQVDEENNNRDDLIQIQNEFAKFEAHVLQSIQQGMQQFDQIMGTFVLTFQRESNKSSPPGRSDTQPLRRDEPALIPRRSRL